MKPWLFMLAMSACGTSSDTTSCTPPANTTAPTYTVLYTQYFAANTPGHCATAQCHADPGYNTWLCGDSSASCYKGMITVGLVDPGNPTKSMIADPSFSPLAWVSPSGNMPFDAPNPFPTGRDAILAWVAACAQDN